LSIYATEKDQTKGLVKSNVSVTTTKVVKKFTTKGRSQAVTQYHNKRIYPEKTPTLPVETQQTLLVSEQILPAISDGFSQLNNINKPIAATVSPLGEWFNERFSWIDSLLNNKTVKPWQKATLAEPAMSPGGVAPVLGKFANKVFISKEASLGGNGVAGGGCGCK
jgi:hypothetical protein